MCVKHFKMMLKKLACAEIRTILRITEEQIACLYLSKYFITEIYKLSTHFISNTTLKCEHYLNVKLK